jgi:hypothetical protein
MAWRFEIEIRQSSGLIRQYIWCDWPRPQRFYSYAKSIGFSPWTPRGSFATYNGQTWFSQWLDDRDPDAPWCWYPSGEQCGGEVTKVSPVYYILRLDGVKHSHPNPPPFGQTGTGRILESPYPVADYTVRWKTMANYPGKP